MQMKTNYCNSEYVRRMPYFLHRDFQIINIIQLENLERILIQLIHAHKNH